MQHHANVAGYVLLRVLDEGIHRLLQRRVPLGLVHELSPGLLQPALVAALHALERHGLEGLVRLDERDRTGRLVNFARLDADEAIFDHVDTADALSTRATVHFLDGLERRHRTAVDGDRDTLIEGDDDLVRQWRVGRIVGVVVDVLRGGVPQIFEEAGLDGAAPHVLVDREGVVLGRLNRQVMLLGVLNRNVTSQSKVTNRRDAVHVGSHRGNRDLETDLIIALARAAVCDGRRAKLAGCLHQVLRDDGTRQRRHEGVLAFVESIGLERRHAVLFCEFVAGICHVCFHSATVEGTLTNDLKILSTLADVDCNGDDLTAGLLADPSDGDRGVQAA